MYNKLIKDINNLLDKSEKDVVWVAVDGPSGSGKSALGSFINDNFICNVFHMDDFFLPACHKTSERLAQAGGNVDYERFKTEIIDNVNRQHNFTFNIYDCSCDSFWESGTVFHKRLNVVEGVYSMHPYLCDVYDYKIFMDVDKTKQLQRIEQRNGKSMLSRFVNEWIPLEDRYFSADDVKSKCDIVFDTTNMF